jgi:hypothetical protein
MDATERAHVRELCRVAVGIGPNIVTKVLNDLEAAERERDDARAEVETLRAEVALLREIIAWPTVTP